VNGNVGIIGSTDKHIEEMVRSCGMRPLMVEAEQLMGPTPGVVPDVVVVDVRTDRRLLSTIASLKRRYPSLGVAIVARALDPELMLEAMRAGVSECIPEPVTLGALEAALGRLGSQRAAPVEGRVFAVVGAKGGVGTTTVAVNLAEALQRVSGDTLLIDLNVANGDAAVFVNVEPRFTVVEALDNTHRLDESFFRGVVSHTESGLELLAASNRITATPVEPQRVRTLMDFAVRYYNCIVLDVPRTDPTMLDALETASSIFVVVNQELPTVRSAFRLVSKLRQRYGGDRVSLLINRADDKSEISIPDIEKAVNARVKHVFPSDYKTALAAVNKGEPLARSTQGRLPMSFHAFVKTLVGKAVSDTDSSRLFGWLSPKRST
jgi:pilus assembly protein CpaE